MGPDRLELATPGSAVRHASVARHVTDCATRPGIDTISMGLSIVYFKGSQVEFSNVSCISFPEGCFNHSKQCRP